MFFMFSLCSQKSAAICTRVLEAEAEAVGYGGLFQIGGWDSYSKISKFWRKLPKSLYALNIQPISPPESRSRGPPQRKERSNASFSSISVCLTDKEQRGNESIDGLRNARFLKTKDLCRVITKKIPFGIPRIILAAQTKDSPWIAKTNTFLGKFSRYLAIVKIIKIRQ